MYHYTSGKNTIFFYKVLNRSGVFITYGYRIEPNGWPPPKQRGWINIKPTLKIIDVVMEERYLSETAVEMLNALEKELECECEW